MLKKQFVDNSFILTIKISIVNINFCSTYGNLEDYSRNGTLFLTSIHDSYKILFRLCLLFVIVLKALSCEFRTGTPWELLYADDLVISAETEEGLKMKLSKWKTEIEVKDLRVNMGKTKIMVSGVNLQTLKDSGEYPCSVCRKGVGSNSIYCGQITRGQISALSCCMPVSVGPPMSTTCLNCNVMIEQ